jgi:hypothetical protein
MASKNLVSKLIKDGKNYDIWHKKVQYLLNEKRVLETLTNKMT